MPAGPAHLRLTEAPGAWADPALAGARITVFATVAAAEPAWRAAVAQGACSVFQTYEWLATWRATDGAADPVAERIVHVAAADGRSLLLLPLAVRRGVSGRVLEFLGGELTDYNMPVVGAGFAPGPADARRLWAAILGLLPPVDLVRLRRMPLAFDGTANPLAGLPGLRHAADAFGAALPGTFEAYAARSPSFFAKHRQYRRRLEREGPVRIAFPEEAAERAALTRFVIAEKARWQRAQGLADTFARPERLAFYETLAGVPFRDGGVALAGLWVGPDPVAGIWGTVFRGRFAVLVTTYREEWRGFSVGRIVTDAAVRMCIDRGDVGVFDLTVGGEGYKASWSDHALPLHELLAARSLRGRGLLAYWRLRERMRTVPWLRRAARAGARLAARVPKRG